LASATDLLSSFENLLGGGAPPTVLLESMFSPPVSFPFPSPGASGQPDVQSAPSSVPATVSTIMGYVRPSVTIQTALGDIVVAPWGQPNGNFLPNIIGLGSSVAAVTALVLQKPAAAKKLGLIAALSFGYGYLVAPSS
jgi:hypothetical protein